MKNLPLTLSILAGVWLAEPAYAASIRPVCSLALFEPGALSPNAVQEALKDFSSRVAGRNDLMFLKLRAYPYEIIGAVQSFDSHRLILQGDAYQPIRLSDILEIHSFNDR